MVTPRTIPNLARFRKELARVAQQGHAIDDPQRGGPIRPGIAGNNHRVLESAERGRAARLFFRRGLLEALHDPQNPSGPYIRRDGMSNPDNFTAHRHALIQLSLQVPALTAAWLLTRELRCEAHAAKHLRAWFLDPATLMHANLQYAQAIHGVTTGRGTGIIDTIHLVEVVRSISILEKSGALSAAEMRGLRKWFVDYLDWMTTSKNGQEERDAKNNHGTCWLMQGLEFATFTADNELRESCRKRFKEVLLPEQIAENGSFPRELSRTKPYGYCLFNLDVMSTVCQILSTREDNLFSYSLPDGRGFAKSNGFCVSLHRG